MSVVNHSSDNKSFENISTVYFQVEGEVLYSDK